MSQSNSFLPEVTLLRIDISFAKLILKVSFPEALGYVGFLGLHNVQAPLDFFFFTRLYSFNGRICNICVKLVATVLRVVYPHRSGV